MRDRTTPRPSRDRRRKLKASEKTEVRSKIRVAGLAALEAKKRIDKFRRRHVGQESLLKNK